VYNAVSSLLLFERRVRAAALASLAAPLGGCVLDVGCGTGFHFPALSRQLGREGLVLGIDPSATSLRVAERRAHRCDLSFVAIKGDGAYGAVPVADVDGVIAVFSLSVMPHWREAVARAAALLRPGGRFVVLEQDLQKEGRIGIVRPLLVVVNRFLGASLDRDYARALSAAGLQVRTERHGPYVVITGDKLFPSSSPGERRGSLHLLVEDHDAVERGTPGAPRECEGPQVRRHAAEDRTARAVAARVHPVDRPVGANVELDAHDDLEGATGRETRVRDRLPGGPEHGIDGRVREWLSASADDGDPHERSEHRRAIHAVTLSKTVYLTYLAEKNGAPNESARTMSLREEAFGRILSVRPEGIIAAAPRTRAACDVLERLVSAEAWGVALGIKGDDDRFDPLYFIAREEAYHVRIGDALLALFGRTRVAKRPSLVSRLAVRAMSVLPAYLADILVYLAERFGAGVFAELMSAILTQLPSLHRAYAEALFETLLRDEAEHAAWALRRLGPRQRWIARAARPVFFWFATREAYRGEVKAHPQAGVAP
jgi:SAM-dependent methyltransferase